VAIPASTPSDKLHIAVNDNEHEISSGSYLGRKHFGNGHDDSISRQQILCIKTRADWLGIIPPQTKSPILGKEAGVVFPLRDPFSIGSYSVKPQEPKVVNLEL